MIDNDVERHTRDGARALRTARRRLSTPSRLTARGPVLSREELLHQVRAARASLAGAWPVPTGRRAGGE